MNRKSIFFSLAWLFALLMILSLPALPQTKTKAKAVRSTAKPVTVTLVRWPYT